MLLTLDKMAERYGMLPSQVLVQASTLDLYVMDAAISYHDYSQRKANGEVAVQYSEQDLLNIIRNTRE